MASLRETLPAIGRITAVRAEFHNIYAPGADKTWFFDRALSGGGALVDLGVHLLDLGLWLLRPADVLLEQAQIERGGIERSATLRMRLDGTAPFDVAVSWNAPLPATRIALEIDPNTGICTERTSPAASFGSTPCLTTPFYASARRRSDATHFWRFAGIEDRHPARDRRARVCGARAGVPPWLSHGLRSFAGAGLAGGLYSERPVLTGRLPS